MRLQILHRALTAALISTALWGAASAASAQTCEVTVNDDSNVSGPRFGTLRYRVRAVNLGRATLVLLRTAGYYHVNAPLRFERSATVSLGSSTVWPGDRWSGDSLIEVGRTCAGCTRVSVDLVGGEIGGGGLAECEGEVAVAPAANEIVEGGMAGPGLVADLLVGSSRTICR
ncbi:MAG TPA: hypothetical protein RMH99_14440 [Sandaracinaceae bacterium LLY-WYZ-13_1]|nr:hypothetical protein [Sandaracinaceae bacterium LLY-WYZ-13_1]